jgi:hypothetical protein
MEEKNSGLLKNAITFGVIIGLVLVVYSVILYIADLTFNKSLGYLQYVFLIIGIFVAVKTYRDKVLGGYISYGKALGFSVLTVVFVGIITISFNYILLRFIDPGLVDKSMAVLQERLENSRFVSGDQIDMMLERSRKNMTALWTLPLGLLFFTFVGFLISLVTSAIVKKDINPVA